MSDHCCYDMMEKLQYSCEYNSIFASTAVQRMCKKAQNTFLSAKNATNQELLRVRSNRVQYVRFVVFVLFFLCIVLLGSKSKLNSFIIMNNYRLPKSYMTFWKGWKH